MPTLDLGQVTGPPGPVGPTGDNGDKGDPGAVYTPTVSADGVISWTNNGGLENPESVNIKGPKGADGTQGTAGAAAGFGTPTATVDANVGTPSVTVTASGPDTAKVFSFAFKNLKGATGATGPQGPAGTSGVTTFNGRRGAVTPQSGDYTASMVGAIPSTDVATIKVLTEAQYDALSTKSATTLYVIKE